MPTSTTQSEIVADLVADRLVAAGATHCFGVVGSTNFKVTRALTQRGVTFVPARHETNAVAMADAWAQTTGGIGVASVHAGPGLTNATMGIGEAAKARTPLVVLAGDAANGAVRSNFLIDQAGLARSVGAVPDRLHTPKTAAIDTDRAVAHARERGPVVLTMPLDVQDAALTGDELVQSQPTAMRPSAPDPAGLAEVADLLAEAERPVLLAGRGAIDSGAGPAIVALGETCGALLATTARAHGLFASQAWSLGISGGFASPGAAALLAEADVIVGFGASFTSWTTRHGRLIAGAQALVQIDDDPARLGAYTPVTLGLVADARTTADALGGQVARRQGTTRRQGWRTDETAQRIAAGANNAFEPVEPEDGTVDPRALTVALDDVLPAERTVAIDGGHFMSWPARHLRLPDERAWVFTQSFQTIGLGLASAIGAAVARPDRLTVGALGDGGASMGLADLETAVRLGLRMVLVVYNDAAYGAEVHHFDDASPADLELVTFPAVDFARIARGHGADGLTVTSIDDVSAVGEWLATHPDTGILVIDARVTRMVVADWLEEAFRGDRR